MERGIWLLHVCCNCNCYFYNFKVIAHQVVLHHCTQVISLNQMIWSSVLMTSKSNQLSWFKTSSKFLFIHFFLPLNISNFSKNCNHSEKGHPSKNWNPTKLSLFENLVGSSTLSKEMNVHTMKLWSILKQLPNKTKSVVRGYVNYKYVYYEWWGKLPGLRFWTSGAS